MLIWNVRHIFFFRCCSLLRSSRSSDGVRQRKRNSRGYLSCFVSKSFALLLLTAASCCGVCNYFGVLRAAARSAVRSAFERQNKDDELRVDEAASTASTPVAPLQEHYIAQLSRSNAQEQHSPLHGGTARTGRSARIAAKEGGLQDEVEGEFEKAGVERDSEDTQMVRGSNSGLSDESQQRRRLRRKESPLDNEGTSSVEKSKRLYTAEARRKGRQRGGEREKEEEREGWNEKDEVEKTEGRVKRVGNWKDEEQKEEEADRHTEKGAQMPVGGDRIGEREDLETDVDKKKEEKRKQTHVAFDSVMEKELEALEKSISSPYIQTPIRSIYGMIRDLNAYFFSTFGRPLLDFPFPFAQLLSSDQYDALRSRTVCRLAFALDTLLPIKDVRLYITLSDRKLGLTADRRVKRSEEGRTYYQAYGSETRVHAAASIPKGCVVSKKLVDAGLIGWTYAGQAPDGSKQIVVTFPNLAHAKELQGEQKVSNEAYQALLDEKGLENVTPMERCLLSGRTQVECDQMKAEASEAEKQVTVPGFSNEGYGENEIRLPRFVYA